MRFTCPACSKSYKMAPEHLGPSGGAKIKCPNCQAIVRVQRGDDDTLRATLAASSAATIDTSAGVAGAAQPASAPLGTVQPASQPAAQPARPVAALRKTGDGASAAPIWHVAVGKAAQGPMSIGQLQALIDRGDITLEALAWRKGMANWTKIADIGELRGQVRAALSKPSADPAGLDPSGNAPTVMADIVQVPEPAQESPSDFYKASTLKPGQAQVTQSASLPRAQVAQASAAQAPQAATRTTGAQAAQPVPQPAAARITGGQAAQPVPQPAAARTTGGQAAQPAAARTTGAQAARPGQAGAPTPSAGGEATHGNQAASFFHSGEGLGDIELDLPDPNKHKPTKEEYQNLLQEFSVMFRLDKRSKRQKVLITAVLSLLAVGVVSFGAILYVQTQKRQALIRDSKTILAVFSLPYNNSVTINLSREAEEEAEKTGQEVAGAPAGTRTTSALANQLRTKIKAQRTASAGGGGGGGGVAKPRPQVLAGAGGGAALKLTKEQQAALDAARADALKVALGPAVGGKVEQVQGMVRAVTPVTTDQLRGLCNGKMPALRGCGEKAGAGGFAAVLTIGMNGGVEKVDALVGGSRDAALAACAERAFGRTNYGAQNAPTTYRCEVN